MSAEARARLAARQAEVVAALAGGGAPPAGFDRTALDLAANSLAAKRRRVVERSWPGIAELLGGRFGELFARYAEAPCRGGPLDDARAFVRWLGERGELDERLAREALLFDLRRAIAPAVRASRASGQLLFGVRLPWGRPRCWALQLPLAKPGHRG